MIPNLEPDTVYAVHLRAPTASGGKDWVGAATSRGEIHTYWGKTGQINQHAAKRGDIAHLHTIVSQKVNGKSYAIIDEYSSQGGWQSQRQQRPPEPEPPKAAPPKPATVIDWGQSTPDSSIQWDF